jgi:hypothetical protein
MAPVKVIRLRGMAQALCLFLLSACGCATYHMGSDTLYAPDVQTVYVPMIESDSLRRDLGERLTEAVVKEIESKTPFKVVSTPNADAILSCHLRNDVRRVLVEDAFDVPRALENNLRAEVTFVNRRRVGMAAVSPQVIDVPPELVQIGQTSVMVPAIGQSVASSQQLAMERLAQQIVGSMEEAW